MIILSNCVVYSCVQKPVSSIEHLEYDIEHLEYDRTFGIWLRNVKNKSKTVRTFDKNNLLCKVYSSESKEKSSL